MARTHSQQFANVELASAVLSNPRDTVRWLATDPDGTLPALWEQAAGDLAPIARVPATGLTATLEPIGLYAIAMVTLPPPREVGDPVYIAIVGRGDGTTRLSTVAYYTLELSSVGKGPPTFSIYTLTSPDMRARVADGPLPDPRWFAEHVIELYGGRLPGTNTGYPTLPFWYWWFAFDGPTAFHMFNMAHYDSDRVEAIRRNPILLMPEITTAIETYSGTAYADKLRETRKTVQRDKAMSDTYKGAINLIASAKYAPLATNIPLALPLVAEGRERGALNAAEADAIEANLLSTLAGLGIDPHENATRAHALHARAQEAMVPRARRGSIAPAHVEDPMGAALFLEQADLPDHQPIEHNDTFAALDPTFLAHGGIRAGYIVWAAPEWSAMSRLIDARWVFRTPNAAGRFMHSISAALGEGLPRLTAPQVGDKVYAFGDDTNLGRRTQIMVVRVGRVVIRLKAIEGSDAVNSRQILHSHLLYPLAGKATVRAHTAQSRYWLALEFPTNSLATLIHSKNQDVGSLLPKFPLLAFGEMPDAIRLLGEDKRLELDEELAKTLALEEDSRKRDAARAAAAAVVERFKNAADTLANYQTQLRAHRWAAYRDAMIALVRVLLATDMGHPLVNAAYAHEIVLELAHMEPTPLLAELDAFCRTRT